MRRFLYSILKVEIIRLAVFAIISGIGLGIFIHGYWLIDLFPIESRRLYYSTIAAGILGMVAYFLLFRWTVSVLSNLSRLRKAGLVGSSILIGVFLFFTATDRWQQPAQYVTMLLPTHSLEILIPSGQEPGGVSVIWFTTSLGEVSYNDVDYKGWNREDDRLVLMDSTDNSIRWTGKTGENVQMVFQSSIPDVDVIVAWDGRDETLTLPKDNFAYQRSFDVPHYASRVAVILLGIFNFSILSLPLCLVVWKKRFDLVQVLNKEFAGKPFQFGRLDVALLVGAILVAILLRVPNLENLYPAVDEYSHLNAAKEITRGAPLNSVYSRSLWVVTIPVSLAFRIFGYEIWAAKLAGILFNVLAIVPLYLIAVKINRPVAVLSILLYAISPWIIALARIAREYAYYPFYYYWIVYAMILFLEGIRDRFRIGRDWKTLFIPAQMLLGIGLAFSAFYAVYFDKLSTIKLILIAYIILCLFVFSRMDLKNRNNLYAIIVVTGSALTGAYRWFGHYVNSVGFDPSPIYYFFPNPLQQWYYDRVAMIPALGLIGAIIVSFFVWRMNFIPLFLASLFAGFLGAFVITSTEYITPRHLSAAHLWYIILIAIGLYLFWVCLQIFLFPMGRAIKYSMVLILGVLVFNGQQVLLPLASRGPYMPITEIYHPEMGPLNEYMLANARREDILISSKVYPRYLTWMDAPEFQDIYLVRADTQDESIFLLVELHDSGWIVLEKIWLEDFAFAPFESLSNNETIEYVGIYGDQYVWRWGVK
jgi:hypothetical protein